jgi:Ser/Thr protein kinase RdoA (MazF antagonist)
MGAQPINKSAMADIVAHFQVAGQVVEAAPYGSGHINDTYAVVCAQGTTRPAAEPSRCSGHTAGRRRMIFQRVNHTIFKDVPGLMRNICRVTEHLRGKLADVPGSDPAREALTVIPTTDGGAYHRTAAGDFWRAYCFIEGAQTYDVPRDNRQIFEAARAFGRFQSLLADLPAPPLTETIANFHHTPMRVANLERAVAADACGRAKECGPEIDFALRFKPRTDRITSGMAAGALSCRVTHNDTKINNVMLDNVTGTGVCVIDLDTVMPGSMLYDFGDQARSTTGRFAENERDLTKIQMDLDRFDHLVRGYLETARGSLNAEELGLLPFAGMLMTYEVGIRFLTDYLQGDVYFRTHRPGENLDRSRTQLALVQQMMAKERELTQIVRKYT